MCKFLYLEEFDYNIKHHLTSYVERLKPAEITSIENFQPFWNELITILDFHAQFHFKVLNLLNLELKTRPTYRQAVDHFRLNCKPEHNPVKTYFMSEKEEERRSKKITDSK